MTLLKRILTAIGLFLPLFVLLYFVFCAFGGAVAGARAGADNPDAPDKFKLGQEAGANFVQEHLRFIALSSLGISLMSAMAISFSGVLPWCKDPSRASKSPGT